MAEHYKHRERKYMITRHSIKPKGEDVESERYKGISKKGVELAREQARNIFNDMEEAEPGTVLWLGGASDEVRTQSTALIYGEEMKKLAGHKKGYIVVTPEDIQGAKSAEELYGGLKRAIDENPDKKIIIAMPKPMKGLSIKQRGWFTKEGKPTEYTAFLAKKFPKEYDAVRHYIATRGVEGNLRGPSPDAVARGYERAVHQLEGEIRSLAGDRPVITGLVGHSYEIDTYLAYIAGNGRIDVEALDAVSSGQGMVKETEKATVTIRPDVTTIDYRGKKHIKHDLEDMVGMIAIGGAFISLFFSFSGVTGNAVGSAGRNNSLGLIFMVIALISGGLWVWLKKK